MGNDIGSGRREPSLLPVPITELPTLRWLRANQNKRFVCRLLYTVRTVNHVLEDKYPF